MAIGKAVKNVPSPVDFFDWNRYNLDNATALLQWMKSFGDNLNDHFVMNHTNTGIVAITPTGGTVDVKPGHVIVRNSNGQYFTMNAETFDRDYVLTPEEIKAAQPATPEEPQ